MAGGALVGLPGLLVVALGFSGGGFFAGTTARAATALALILLLWVTLAERPFEGLNGLGVLAGGSLALFATWALASSSWSDAPARALLEFDRALLYLLTLLLFGLGAWTPARARWLLRILALAFVAVCLAGLATRCLPGLWPVELGEAPERLSFPIGYWNALGVAAAVGAVLCVHLTSSEREPPAARALGAAALPLLATALLLTFSRGAILAAGIGLLTYALVARPRLLASGLLAWVPAAAVAVVAAYRADLLATPGYGTPAGAAQGARLALVLVVCAVAGAALRMIAAPLDSRLVGLRLPKRKRRIALVVTCLVLVVGGAASGYVLDVPARASAAYENFTRGGLRPDKLDVRGRLADTTSSGRIENWRVALSEWRLEPLHGRGAGTFQTLWTRDRRTDLEVKDAHSLYLEVLAELGLVGLVLLATTLGALLLGVAIRCRGPERAVFGAGLAAMVTWTAQAGIDWLWELPAVTIWLFAMGGALLAVQSPAAPGSRVGPGGLTRVSIGLGCLVLAVTPALIAVSQYQLDRGVRAFKSGDCEGAIDAALASTAAVGARPEPFEIMAYCDARVGDGGLAVRSMEAAVARDPNSWELHYGLALVRGAAGLDPRPAARDALALNPRGELAQEGVDAFSTADRKAWERRARSARLPLP